ncbi:MAG: type II and III secretion system protein family protein [Rhodospirillales bacterium]|nr:type II and III secretion system protein family protein [Rhodospirillales bacterium]
MARTAPRGIMPAWALLCIACCAVNPAASGIAAPVPAPAPIPVPAPAPPRARQPARTPIALSLQAGTGRVMRLPAVAASVLAADPKVAEVRPASPTTLFIFGIAPGRTTVAAISERGVPIAQYDVTVQPSAYGAMAAQAAMAQAMPGRDIHVDAQPNGLAVRGAVRSPAEAATAMGIAQAYALPHQLVDNRLVVQSSIQVNLRVRIAEMSRSVTRELGVNWQALGSLGQYASIGLLTSNPLADAGKVASALTGGYNFNTPGHVLDVNGVIDALAQDQLVHVLAEPNLTATSGETASFLVGGEFPIPVAQQNNQTTIEFKQYGVSLAFVPTVHSDGRISIKVRPEVSALSTQGAVQLSAGNASIQVPALTVRRAETTVELSSGQSFAIAGLLQDSTALAGNALPMLGEVPILGALFRSDSFQRNQTELVIVVTPYLVRGVSDPRRIRLPTDHWRPPSDLERILLLRQSARGGPAGAGTAAHIPGDAGFLVR